MLGCKRTEKLFKYFSQTRRGSKLLYGNETFDVGEMGLKVQRVSLQNLHILARLPVMRGRGQ